MKTRLRSVKSHCVSLYGITVYVGYMRSGLAWGGDKWWGGYIQCVSGWKGDRPAGPWIDVSPYTAPVYMPAQPTQDGFLPILLHL